MRKFNISRSIFFTILISSLFSTTPTFADKLELTNGKVYEGKIISVGAKQVILKGDKGKMLFSKNQVAKIMFEDKEDKVVKKEEPKKVVKKEEPKKVVKKELTTSEKAEKPKLKPKKVFAEKPTPKAEPQKQIALQSKTNKPTKKPIITEPEITKPAQTQPSKKDIVIGIPKVRPSVDFVTFIKGNQSNNIYFGIYSNELNKENLKVFFPDQTPEKLSFNIHAQQNGQIPPLHAASSVVFVMKNGKMTAPTEPTSVEKTAYHEWFSNLENIAGVSGERNISMQIPKEAIAAIIIGNRPGSKNNLVGYISNIKIDDKLINRMISN